jgi:hypothetical protein
MNIALSGACRAITQWWRQATAAQRRVVAIVEGILDNRDVSRNLMKSWPSTL